MTDRIPLDHLTSDQYDELCDTVDRVRALADQWVKAGPPPLGTPIARWVDRRLVELNTALGEPTPAATQATKEQPGPA